MLNVSEQRLAVQVRIILKSDWLATVELEEILRRSDLLEMKVIDGVETRRDNEHDEIEDDCTFRNKHLNSQKHHRNSNHCNT